MKIKSIREVTGRGLMVDVDLGDVPLNVVRTGTHLHQGTGEWQITCVETGQSDTHASLRLVRIGDTDHDPKFGTVEL